MRTELGYILGILALAACGSSKPKGIVFPGEDAPIESSDETVTDEEVAEVLADVPQYDETMGKRILKRGARKAAECASRGAPSGESEVVVIFDGTKGQVVDVELGDLFSDAKPDAKKCVQMAFIGEYVPPFDGKKRVTHTINIPEPGDASEPEKK